MALDPNDPMQQALYPVPADLVWPPPEYAGLFTFAPQDPALPPPDLALTEYGLPSIGAGIPGGPPPPPPPPPPVKRFGGQPPIEETAAPIPGAQPAPELVPMQPGTGIPASTADAAAAQLPAGAGVSDLVNVGPELTGARDPWEVFNGQPTTPTDDERLATALQQHAGGPLTPSSALTPEERLTAQLDELDDRQLAEYGKRDPEGFVAYLTRKDEQRRVDIAERGQAIAERNRAAEAENIRLRAEAMKKADAAQAQLQQESDSMAADGGFWDSRTDGQKFLGLLSIGLGAFVAGPGGQNKALEIWERSIDRHVANAKRKLADKNSAVARMYARVGDDFLANEAMRQGALKGAYADLASQEQLYDPRGTSARRSAQKRLEISQAIAASEQKVREHAEKQYIEAQKFLLDVKKAAETERNNREQTKTANWKIAVDKQQGDKRLAFDEKKFAHEVSKVDATAIAGNVNESGAPVPMVQADGKTLFNPKDDVKKQLVSQRSGIQALHDKLGQLKEWRRKHGGTNAKTSPAAQAEYDRLVGSAVREYALAKGIPMGDEADREAAKKELLGADPSAYNISDVEERIDKTLRELDTGFNTTLQGYGYSGQRITFIDHPPEAVASKTEKELEGLFKPAVSENTSNQFYQDQGQKTLLLQELQQQAASTDPAISKTAFDRLHAAADTANDKFVREKAQQILSTLTASSIPLSGATPSQHGVREKMPGTLDYVEDQERAARQGGQ